MFNKYIPHILSLLTISVLLSACSSSGTDSGSGTLNLNITDAPIDSAAKVVVSFNGVSIKPQNGPAYDIDFVDNNNDPVVKTIDLLSQQGPNSEPLLVNHTLAAGHYEWLRLKVISNQASTDSYIELDNGSQHPLYVPSGDQTGLKLNRGFDISDGGAASFTIDFDLRKSVLMPNLHSIAYKLKPSLRIVQNNNAGHISGNVGPTTLADAACIGNDYAVYVFAGDGITPDDVDSVEPNPVTTALLDNSFNYAAGFLNAGTYTISFTCHASDDDNEVNDVIQFIGTDTVTVNAGTTTSHHFD